MIIFSENMYIINFPLTAKKKTKNVNEENAENMKNILNIYFYEHIFHISK